MRVRIHVKLSGFEIDQVADGERVEDVVHVVKVETARRSKGLARLAINAMGDLSFAREVVKRYNAQFKSAEPLPNSAAEFLDFGVRCGFAEVLPEGTAP